MKGGVLIYVVMGDHWLLWWPSEPNQANTVYYVRGLAGQRVHWYDYCLMAWIQPIHNIAR